MCGDARLVVGLLRPTQTPNSPAIAPIVRTPRQAPARRHGRAHPARRTSPRGRRRYPSCSLRHTSASRAPQIRARVRFRPSRSGRPADRARAPRRIARHHEDACRASPATAGRACRATRPDRPALLIQFSWGRKKCSAGRRLKPKGARRILLKRILRAPVSPC